jgi:membrane protein required for colicin V production
MLTIDYILLAALLVSIVVGLFRGFFREALSLVIWVVALWIALRYSSVLEPLLGSISSEALKIWSARLIMFVLILIAGGLLNALIAILVEKTGLTGTDRVLGMVFGAARGALILGIVVMMFRLLDLDQEAWWSESRVIPLATPVADVLQTYFHQGLERLEDMVPAGGVPTEPETPAETG